MSAEAVEASRATAVHLSRHFYCMECRSFFTEGILKPYGLPPTSTDRDAHAKCQLFVERDCHPFLSPERTHSSLAASLDSTDWNFGHNVASEHVATTIGGMPWIHPPIGGTGPTAELKNAFFMPYDVAKEQWTYKA